MSGIALAAQSLSRAFVQGTVANYFTARQALADANLTDDVRAAKLAQLAGRLREECEKQRAEIQKHALNAQRAAVENSPSRLRRDAMVADPMRVFALRSLLAQSSADIVAVAAVAVEDRDWTLASAIVGLTRDGLDGDAARAIESVAGMQTERYTAAVAEVVICRSEAARVATALELAAPDGKGRGFAAANEALSFDIGERHYQLAQKDVVSAYRLLDVGMAIEMPNPPVMAEFAA